MTTDSLKKSPSGKILEKTVVYDESGIEYSGDSSTIIGYQPSKNGDTVEIDFTSYTGTTPLDMGGHGIINHYDQQDEWTDVAAGVSTQSILRVDDNGLGNSTGNRRTVTFEVDVEDSDGANPKSDVFVFLMIARADGQVEIVNMANGNQANGAAIAILSSVVGTCSGYSYRVLLAEASYIILQITQDALIARKARCRVSLSSVRSAP